MTGATREAGLPKSYYAPEFSVEVDGAPLKRADKFDVIEIVVTMDVADLTSVDLKLNNYDDRSFDLKWSDSDKFRIGAKVLVKLGYADELRTMLSGYVTTLTPSFPSDGPPTLGVRVLDPLVKLKGSKPPPDQVQYKDMTDSQIAEKIARRHNLRSKVDDSKTKYKVMDQENKDDAQFLKLRAAAINFDVFMRTDPKKKDDVLHFVRPADGVGPDPIRTYVLAWGTLRNTDVAPSLIDFRPTIAAANQVKSVTVRGWDVDKKKPIEVKATPDNTADVMGQKGERGADAATQLGGETGKDEVIVGKFVSSEEEAFQLAKAELARLSYGYKTAKGKLIGLPDLRLNDNVEINGVGKRFGGLYHVTKVIHTLNDKGYVTEFEARGGRAMTDHPSNGAARYAQAHRGLTGVMIGIVTDVNDKDGLGRVEISLPWYAEGYRRWARVVQLYAGDGYGSTWIPEKDGEVLVGFDHGNLRSPYVIGCLHGKVDKPPHSRSSSTDIRTLLTPSGSELSFDEKKKTISLKTSKGASVVLKEDSGEITLTATKTITLDADNVVIKGKSSVKVSSNKIELN